jgi:hypothetical protein
MAEQPIVRIFQQRRCASVSNGARDRHACSSEHDGEAPNESARRSDRAPNAKPPRALNRGGVTRAVV